MKPFYLVVTAIVLILMTGAMRAQETIRYIGNVGWSPTNQLVTSAPSGLAVSSQNAELNSVISEFQSESASSSCILPADHPTFSPDGTLFAYVSPSGNQSEIIVIETDTQKSILTFQLATQAGTDIAFNSSGSFLAVVERFRSSPPFSTNRVQIWDVLTGQKTQTIDFSIENGGILSWGNTENTLWMLGSDNNGVFSYLRAINVTTGERVYDVAQPYNFFLGGLPAINNQWIVFWTFIDAPEVPGFAIYRLDASIPNPQPTHIIPFDQNFYGLTITQQGDRMAFATDDKTFVIFDVVSQQIIQTAQTNEPIRELSFSPDGSLLAVTTFSQARDTQDVEVWDTQAMTRLETISMSASVDPDCP